MSDYILVFCTIDSKEQAQRISRQLIESKLAACVNIISGVSSVYFWEGKVVEDNEFLLIIKSKSSIYKELEKKIKELHPYEVAEIISVKIDEGSDKYLDWIRQNTL